MERRRRAFNATSNYYHNRNKKLSVAFFVFLLGYFHSHFPDRNVWVKHWVARRKKQGLHHNLFLELMLEDPQKYRRFPLSCYRCLRMSTAMFEELLSKVSPIIQRKDTHLRESISPAERLSVTLRHLATGESQESLQMSFRIGQSTISGIIKDTVRAIYKVLKDDFLRFPSSAEEWKAVAQDIYERWNFPNCMGAMDGKHFLIDCPIKSGSMFYNYKSTFSIVLLAVVDAQLRFIFIDVGTNGRACDRGIWNSSDLKSYVENYALPRAPLPNSDIMFPYVIVGDEGFTLSEHVMIPYSKGSLANRRDRKIFNYRLSRFRRCSENAFGILVTRFQIFRSAMRYDPDVAKDVILATLALHNWLRTDTVGRSMYSPPQSLDSEDVITGRIIDGNWRDRHEGRGVMRLANQGGNHHAASALELRNVLCEYFNGIGAVPWQDRMIGVPAE
ncbi:Protein ALP1-like [Frankliniella fusca]|uniref:Protein ALP1-like n=1 Tax=Frankliniella fusca TaxID=407009 RepID=A0AAE1HRB8_9NEOP|nr:Protein ALP1-like [Frankliniella fusca]